MIARTLPDRARGVALATVLGVDRSPFGDRAKVRRSLVEALRRAAKLSF